MESTYTDPKRIQESLLSPLEKRVLHWLAHRLPGWLNSDHLTILGFIGMVLAGVAYFFSNHYRFAPLFASVFLMINWFGDSLDGTIARLRNRQRPRYGFYVDHIVDTFGALFLLSGLAFSGLMDPRVAYALLIVYFMLSIDIYLATFTTGSFRLSFWIFGPTELRVLICIGNIVVTFHPISQLFGMQFRLLDVGGVIAIPVLAIILLVSVIRNVRFLYLSELI